MSVTNQSSCKAPVRGDDFHLTKNQRRKSQDSACEEKERFRFLLEIFSCIRESDFYIDRKCAG
jgi:hypothetical protein